MGKIIFILGGARSGKSNYATELARKHGGKVAFIATCLGLDKEMARRIEIHKKKRPSHWKTFEETRDIASVIKRIGNKFELILIDCLTLWVSNLLLAKFGENIIENKINKILSILKKNKTESIIVSNEVGSGIVPQNKLARQFRDIAGKINQRVALSADEVILMVSGVPLILKKK